MKFKVRIFVVKAVALISALAILLTLASVLSGCARPEDLPQSTRAMIQLPNGEVVEGEMSSYSRWSEGWMKIVIDGVTYTVNEINVVIIEK